MLNERAVNKRIITGGRVTLASCVALERANTGGHVAAAGWVAIKGSITVARVVVPGCVAMERLITVGRVELAGCVVKQRLKTVGCIGVAGCEAEERRITLSSVLVGIASVRWWINRSRHRRESKRCKREHKGNKSFAQQTISPLEDRRQKGARFESA